MNVFFIGKIDKKIIIIASACGLFLFVFGCLSLLLFSPDQTQQGSVCSWDKLHIPKGNRLLTTLLLMDPVGSEADHRGHPRCLNVKKKKKQAFFWLFSFKIRSPHRNRLLEKWERFRSSRVGIFHM